MISLAAAASLSGLDTADVRRLLDQLTAATLLTEEAPGRFAIHDLLHAYARERVHTDEPGPDRDDAVRRMLDHYLHTADRAGALLYPHRYWIGLPPARPRVTIPDLTDHAEALAWFTTEHDTLGGAAHIAEGHGSDRHVWQSAGARRFFLDRRSEWHEMAAGHEAGLAAAQRLGDDHGVAQMTHGLALAYRYLGDHDRAKERYHHAIACCRNLGDLIGVAHGHLNLALVFETTDEIGEAMRHAELSLETFGPPDTDRARPRRSTPWAGTRAAWASTGRPWPTVNSRWPRSPNSATAMGRPSPGTVSATSSISWVIFNGDGGLPTVAGSLVRTGGPVGCRRGAGAVGRLP